MGLVARKPVFRVSEKASFKPVSSATQTGWKIEISPVASLHMILSTKRITKALIRLRRLVCACVVGNPRRQVFLRRGLYLLQYGFRSHTICLNVFVRIIEMQFDFVLYILLYGG